MFFRLLRLSALFTCSLLVSICSGCSIPTMTGLVVHNHTDQVVKVDVYDPTTTPADERTVYPGGERLLTHQRVSSVAFGCKAEFSQVALTVKYPNGVSIPYSREELLKMIQWDSKQCVWNMDISIIPMGNMGSVAQTPLPPSSEQPYTLPHA